MVIRKVGVLSLAKIVGTIYAAIGLIAGVFLALFALLGGLAGEEGFMASLVFGPLAIIVLPIFYGVLGFVGGAITGWVFNRAAALMGGLEIEVDGA